MDPKNISQLFFNRTVKQSASSDKRQLETVVRPTEAIFSIFNKYLWAHGIGFEKGICCRKKKFTPTFMSVLFAILAESGFAIFLCAYYVEISSTESTNAMKSKSLITDIIIMSVNFLIRICFYTRRRNFENTMRELGSVYASVCSDETPLKTFGFKLAILLFARDVYNYCFLLSLCYLTHLQWNEEDSFARYVHQPYAGVCWYVTLGMCAWLTVDPAVTAFFSAACFVLEQSLDALNEKLQHANDNEELERLSKAYLDISDTKSKVNKFIHPFLLATCAISLIKLFADIYNALFYVDSLPSTLRTANALVNFSHFACICHFGSSVVEAASKVRCTARAKSVQISRPEISPYVAAMEKDMEGFKLLGSIVVDDSLILSAFGNLLTYGILAATFQTSSKTGHRGK